MPWSKEIQDGNETGKIRWELVPYTRGLGLDIGCGAVKAFPHFIGVDNRKDTKLFGQAMDPDMTVPDATVLPMYSDGCMDFVFSSHTLEHLTDYKAALKEWWRVLKIGGYLCLYLPHKDFYPNCGSLNGNPDHKWDFLPQDIIDSIDGIADGFDLVRNEDRNENIEYSFFQVYKKTESGRENSWSLPRPEKKAAVIRYGAFGDILQTASVCAGLKDEGFHVTLYCEPRGYEIAKTDPHIDEFIIQDQDQVPNSQLGPFWDYIGPKYDRMVNLCESVEGALLALPDRMTYRWTQSARHRMMNKNYLEFAHSIAQTNYHKTKTMQKFWPTDEEVAWAKSERAKMPGVAVMWALAGSSVHKVWHWIDVTFARLMLATDATVITVGDDKTKMLEAGWEKEGRVYKRSGAFTIRQSLALAQQCDIVVGPETGVLNSVAYEKNIGKIVMLSHSSVENLTRDWVNTTSLWSKNTPCYPCHKMIYEWKYCVREEEGVAACQKDIHPDQMWRALCKMIHAKNFTQLDKKVA